MKSKNGIVRLIVEIPVDIHRVFKEEALFRNMTLKRLMMEAFIEKLKRDHSPNSDITTMGKWGYESGITYRKTVLEIPVEIHTVIKAEAAWQCITIKEYITSALIEKMRHDSQYRLNK